MSSLFSRNVFVCYFPGYRKYTFIIPALILLSHNDFADQSKLKKLNFSDDNLNMTKVIDLF